MASALMGAADICRVFLDVPLDVEAPQVNEDFRLATVKDTLFIAGLLRRFYKRSGSSLYHIPYDHESCVLSIEDTINRGVVMIGPSSCAGALIVPFPFNFNIQVAQIFFWFCEDKREVGVFDALLKECANRGAAVVNAATLAPDHGGKRFYARRNLAPVEVHHLGINPEFACALVDKGAKEAEMNELETASFGGPS